MLPDKLKDWQYYVDKLPLYLKNASGYKEHFEILYDLLVSLSDMQDKILDALNILQANYFDKYVNNGLAVDNELYADDSLMVDGNQYLLFDYIAALFGLTRNFSVTYDDGGGETTTALSLSNEELYLLIKARIIQNNYDGSYTQAMDYYSKIGLPIYFVTAGPAQADLYLDTTTALSDNIQVLFLAGLFTLQSLGITYDYHVGNVGRIGVWGATGDTVSNKNSWNNAYWG